jgi:hypothetical protein
MHGEAQVGILGAAKMQRAEHSRMGGMRRRSLQEASAEWCENGSGKRLVYLIDLRG